jgi:hypothetical protein
MSLSRRAILFIFLSVLVTSNAYAFRSNIAFWIKLLISDNTSALFNQGTSTGTVWDATNSLLRLDQTGTATDIEFDPSWTPAWSNIVGYWKMNGTVGGISDGSTVTATVGSNGTAKNSNGTGMAYVSGVLNQGISFDGTDDYIDTGGFAPTVRTVSFWLNLNNYNNFPIVYAGTDTYNSSSWNWSVYIYGSTFWIRGNAGSGATINFTSTTFPTGSWAHIALVRNGGSFTAFVNGVKYTSSDSDSTDGVLRIGKSGSNYFSGKLDELAVWNTPLPDAAILTIYQHQLSKYAGTFQSRVIDALASTSWTGLSWVTTLPFLKELPDYASSSVQNETSANYSSLQGDTPAVGDNNLMTGILGLWHLDEASWSGTSGEVKDRSGQTNNGTAHGGASTVTAGILGNAGSFVSSSSQYVDVGTAINPSASTYTAWVKATSFPNAYTSVISRSEAGPASLTNTLLIKSNGKLACYVQPVSGGQVNYDGTGATTLSAGQWYFLAMTYDSVSGLKCYVNGNLDGSAAANGVLKQATGYATWIGGHPSISGRYFNGLIDEASVWGKALNSTEIKQLYRRGANRIRYQVRSCPDSTCSTNPSWLGPNNTNQTYFSELNNNAIPSDGADLSTSDIVQNGQPTITFANFSSAVSANRYIQYRAILESDDTNTNCNYSGSATWCSPELKSVNVMGP